uniref:GMC family oxidoreductase N-terminal domain-containing protein n=1 Tax=Fodinicola feengrottensis TaxID=435914 RepID=UPI0036F236E7
MASDSTRGGCPPPSRLGRDRTGPLARGRVVGGCAQVNGRGAVRAMPRDYDAWAARGMPRWSWEQSRCCRRTGAVKPTVTSPTHPITAPRDRCRSYGRTEIG